MSRGGTFQSPRSPAGQPSADELSAQLTDCHDVSDDPGRVEGPQVAAEVEAKPTPLFRFDPGWLFLISGLVIVAAVVLIPAQHDLDEARWQRDRALAIEQHRTERLSRYGAYLAALRQDDPCVLLSLAATQLNLSPRDRVPLDERTEIARTSASVFPNLEPGPLVLPPKPRASDVRNRQNLSILERLSINNTSRLWLIAGGMMCVLLGLLPTSARGRVGRVAGTLAGSAVLTAEAALSEAGQSVSKARVKWSRATAAVEPEEPYEPEWDGEPDEGEEVEAVEEFEDDGLGPEGTRIIPRDQRA